MASNSDPYYFSIKILIFVFAIVMRIANPFLSVGRHCRCRPAGVPLYDMDRASNGRYLAVHEEVFDQIPPPASIVYPTHNGSHKNYDIALDFIEQQAQQLFNINPLKLDRANLPDATLLQYLMYIEIEAEKLLKGLGTSRLN
jgi:hypothetical protein